MPPKKTAPPTDFKKKVARVGKAKPGAANTTNTSFKAAKLKIGGTTSTTEDPLGAIIESVLHQCNNHSVSIRRDGFLKLARIIKEHKDDNAQELQNSLPSILAKTCKQTFLDEDDPVRTAAFSLYKMILEGDPKKGGELSRIFPIESLKPFLSAMAGTAGTIPVMAFVHMALSHIRADIRFDAWKTLGVLSHLNILPLWVGCLNSILKGCCAHGIPSKVQQKSNMAIPNPVEIVLQVIRWAISESSDDKDIEEFKPFEYTWREGMPPLILTVSPVIKPTIADIWFSQTHGGHVQVEISPDTAEMVLKALMTSMSPRISSFIDEITEAGTSQKIPKTAVYKDLQTLKRFHIHYCKEGQFEKMFGKGIPSTTSLKRLISEL